MIDTPSTKVIDVEHQVEVLDLASSVDTGKVLMDFW